MLSSEPPHPCDALPPVRPRRPPNWKEAHRVGAVQPGGKMLALDKMDVHIASILPDVRRTYIELRWSPPLKIRMFMESASLTDAMGHPLARRPEWDAGTNRGEYFLGFDPLPKSCTHAILTLRFKIPPGEATVPIRLDTRLRSRGTFDIAAGTTITVLGRRFEVIAYRGGVTEAGISYRFQCGAAGPVHLHGTLSRQRLSLVSIGQPDGAGRIESEFIVEGPTDPAEQSFRLHGIDGWPLAEPIVVPYATDEQQVSVRRDGVLLALAVLWEQEGWMRIRSPHVQAPGAVEVRGVGHPRLAGHIEPTDMQYTNWAAASELRARFPPDTSDLTLHSLNLGLDPPPALRLGRG